MRNMPLEPDPLIGSPVATIFRSLVRPSARFGRGWEDRVARESVSPEFLKRPDVFVNMGINQDNVNC